MFKDTNIELKGEKRKKCQSDDFTIHTLPICLLLLVCLTLLSAVVSFGCPEEVTFTIQWYLKYYPCHNDFSNIDVSTTVFTYSFWLSLLDDS